MLKDWSVLVLGMLAVGACKSRPLPEPPPAPEGVCNEVRLAVGCTVGRCTLAAARRTLEPGQVVELAERELPEALAGDAIAPFLCEVTLPAGATPKAELSLRVRLEGDSGTETAVTLFAEGARDSDGPTGEDGVSGGPARLVPSRVFPGAVHGLITGSGRYGVTLLPPPRRTDEIGIDPLSSVGPAALLRNLSSQPVGAAFYDGQRLYVGNGPRLLVYDGLPASPTVRPRLVLGQPDLDTVGRGANAGASASRFDSAVNAVWSDGTRLFVATGNRILLWRALPERDYAPADAVLGQLDFSSNGINAGGVSARSLNRPMSIDSDGTRLFVADTLNNRVLLWQTLPTQIAQPADGVLGQPSFTSAAREAGATPLYQVWGALLMPSGALVASLFVRGVQHVVDPAQNNPAPDFTLSNPAPRVQPDTISAPAGMVRTSPGSPGGGGGEIGVAVRDTFGNRVALFRSEPRGPRSIDVVLGQPDPLRQVSGPVYGSSLTNNYPLGSGAGTLLVPDGNRLLVYERTPEYHFAPPDRVLGQAGFTTNEARLDYRGIAATTLAAPADVALTGELLAVVDRGNNRVLVYRRRDLGSSGAAVPAAAVVLGQPDATSFVPNRDQLSPGAATLSGPAGVALDGAHLIVADSENHRVLVWNGVPSDPAEAWENGRPADLVLGQADFSGRRPNHGRGDADGDGYGDADADGFFYPVGVASDGVRLLVADRLNHRVLLWRTFPTRNGQPADAVLGQDDFRGNRANHGRGPYTVMADGFNLPTGVTLGAPPPSVPPLGGDTLWVADTENNRVVRWDGLDGNTPRPTAFLGQPNGTTVTNLNYAPLGSPNAGFQQKPPTTAGSVLRPRGVALVGGEIYVSETDSHRVHRFDATTLVPAGVLGQVDPTSGVSNAGGVSAGSLAAPLGLASDGQELWVADANNHRLLGWPVELPPAQGQVARGLIGQSTFAANGFDQSSTAAGGVVDGPRGLAVRDGVLYVADSDHHRVLALTRGAEDMGGMGGMGGMSVVRVYGQPDGSLVLPNAGGAPSAASLQSPAGVALDATHLIVADTGNHRVLIYDRVSEQGEAALVLGQADFTRNAANRGGAADAGTLYTPQSVYSDGTFLAVADTGNHRVLVWSTFPTESGQPADVVLGQASMSEALPNRGGAVPDAGTMVFPAAVLGVGDALLVADSGNNRVLRFAGRPRSNGAAADGVVGQDAPTARVPATLPTDRDHLAGPTALATDGTYLYVLDRDLGRVVAYALAVLGPGTEPAQAGLILGGGAEGLTLLGPAGLQVERTAAFTTRLYVGDTGGDRVVVLGPVSRLAAAD